MTVKVKKKKGTSIPPSKAHLRKDSGRKLSPEFQAKKDANTDTNTNTKKKTLRERLKGVHEKLKPTLKKAGAVAETKVFGDLAEMSKGESTGSGGPIGKGADPAATSPLVYHDPSYEAEKKKLGL